MTVRTGQAHRTLIGHTGPVTCVQFDEYHLVSGSLDKSIRVSVLSVDSSVICTMLMIVSELLTDLGLANGTNFRYHQIRLSHHRFTVRQPQNRFCCWREWCQGKPICCFNPFTFETDFSLRFAGLQPNYTRAQHSIYQRSHCACRATTVHGQIPRNWFKRLYGQSLGFTLRKRRELYLISNSKEHFATPCLLYPFRTPYSSALFTIVTFVKRERE